MSDTLTEGLSKLPGELAGIAGRWNPLPYWARTATRLVSVQGRARRREFWWTTLVLLIAVVVLASFVPTLVAFLIAVPFGATLWVRRSHDLGRGWIPAVLAFLAILMIWYLGSVVYTEREFAGIGVIGAVVFAAVFVVCLAAMIDLGFSGGQSLPNDYGPTVRPEARWTFWRRLLDNPLAFLASMWLLMMIVAWIWPELLATKDPFKQDVTLSRLFELPSSDFWLGTDQFGRDYFSRVIFGAGFAFRSILIAMSIAVGIGVPLGLLSGWRGGRLDRAIMWVNDVLFSLPIILLAMAVIIVLSPSLTNAMVGVGIAMSTRFTRLTRAVTLAEKEELYVDAARITGLSTPTILTRYITPNLMPSLVIQAAIISGAIILIGATLSFLGVGANLDDPDWGVMLNRSQNLFRREGVWQITPPGLTLVLTVLSFNLLGDGIRDALGRDASSNALTITKRIAVAPAETAHATGDDVVLSLRNMDVEFPNSDGRVSQILNDVSLEVRAGETLGVVGESGSGKSMTMLSALGLTPAPGRMTRGSVSFGGRDVTNLTESEWQRIRGKDIGIIFQEPIAVLNPAIKVGKQIMEPLRIHMGMSKAEARKRAAELLAEVRVPDPERRLDQYPHEFSGGMAQRVGIAMALACEPKLLIADEPSTALDVTVQGQILDLMREVQERRNMAIILITHDLGVIAEAADRVLVMYGGQVMETATAEDVFFRPKHPYARALLETMPQNHEGHGDLAVIPGVVPSATAWPTGCRFAPRCAHAVEACSTELPPLERRGDDLVRCLRVDALEQVDGADRVEESS